MQPSNTASLPVRQKLSLFDYLQIIANRKKMIFLVTFATALATVGYTLLLPNIYAARTMILPAQEDKGLMSVMMGQLGGLANLAGAAVGGTTTADLYVSMLKSESVKDPVIDRFSLMTVYRNKYRTDTYKILEKNSFVSSGKKDGIITITVYDKDPKRAAGMANAYVEELGKLAIRLDVAGAGQNRTFLEERLSSAKGDLIKAEENLRAFQARNKAVNVSAQAEATIKGVAELRAQLALQEVQLATYRRRFTESIQEVKNLATSVANLRSQIAKLEGAGESSSLPSVGSVPAIGQEYVRLMREFKTQESLVELLTRQFELTKLTEARDVSPFQVIQEAKVPERKVKPERAKIVVTYTFTAFMAAVILALLLNHLERMPAEAKSQWKSLIGRS